MIINPSGPARMVHVLSRNRLIPLKLLPWLRVTATAERSFRADALLSQDVPAPHEDIVRRLPRILLTHPEHVVALGATCEPRAHQPIVTNQPSAVLCKRIGDVAIALWTLLLLFPILLAITLVIKAVDRGPVFLAHTRIGRYGRPFRCYKFRTMVTDADERLRQLLASDCQLAEQWRSERKLRRDPRVTPIGRCLRKTSLDEVPQLFNVLRGEMSCVGPRPVTADELTRYGKAVADYSRVRPGMTGLWQVCGRSHRSYAERIALDCLYVQAWSLKLDLAILLRTIPTVLRFDQTA